jgi:hypothetical protein
MLPLRLDGDLGFVPWSMGDGEGRGGGQGEVGSRDRDAVEGAGVGGEGSGEEQDEPDRGVDPERPNAQQPEYQPGPRALEDRERRQPGEGRKGWSEDR